MQTVKEHIQALLEDGLSPEAAAYTLCERLENFHPYKDFVKQGRELAEIMVSRKVRDDWVRKGSIRKRYGLDD